jgi:serine/threonine protein kinase
VRIARGLFYLHKELQPCIIHQDIKAFNIFLDKKFNTKIADFELARLFSNDQSHLFTQQKVLVHFTTRGGRRQQACKEGRAKGNFPHWFYSIARNVCSFSKFSTYSFLQQVTFFA